MGQTSIALAVAASLLGLAPTAGADIVAHFGPLAVQVENGRDQDCVPLNEACIFGYQPGSSDSLSDDQIDAYQQFGYVGAAGDVGAGPDANFGANLSEFEIDHPLGRLLDEMEDVHVNDNYSIHTDDRGLSVNYYGPSAKDAEHPLAQREYAIAWSSGEGSGVTSDNASQLTHLGDANSDDRLRGPGVFCDFAPSPLCASTHQTVSEAMVGTAPNVRYGLDAYDVELTSNRSELGELSRTSQAEGGILVRKASPDRATRLEPSQKPGSPSEDHRGEPNGYPRGRDPFVPPQSEDVSKSSLVKAPPQSGGEAPLLKLVAAAASFLILLLAAALYARLTSKQQVLATTTRQRIVALLQSQGATTLPHLCSQLEIHRATLFHHLRILERARLVVLSREGRQVVVRAAGTQSADTKVPVVLRRHPVAGRMIEALRSSSSGLTREALHQAAGEAPERTRRYIIARLVEKGVIREHGRGPEATFVLATA